LHKKKKLQYSGIYSTTR